MHHPFLPRTFDAPRVPLTLIHPFSVIPRRTFVCLALVRFSSPILKLRIPPYSSCPNLRSLLPSSFFSLTFPIGTHIPPHSQIESNLASKICTPQYSRDELAKYVHRPIFKPLAYFSSAASDDPPFSTNLASLSALIKTLDIEVDPYVVGLRRQLARAGQKCGVSSDG